MTTKELVKDYEDIVIKANFQEYQSMYQYRNGVHLLFITSVNGKYYLCGLGTGFHVMTHKNDYDVYMVFDDIVSAVREYERFITLLLLPRKFERSRDNVLIPDRDSKDSLCEVY